MERWPSASATVTSTKVVSSGGRLGKTMNVRFTYMAGSKERRGKLFVDDKSSLYGLSEGKQFTVQYNPAHPSLYYCKEAHTRSLTIKLTLAIVGFLFAVAEFLIEYFGR
jgi:hypothetical protein